MRNEVCDEAGDVYEEALAEWFVRCQVPLLTF